MIKVVEVLRYVALERCIAGQKQLMKLFIDLLTNAELIAPSLWMIAHIGEWHQIVDFAVKTNTNNLDVLKCCSLGVHAFSLCPSANLFYRLPNAQCT